MPNILLLVIDSLRSDHVGFCGGPLAASPCIDSLAAEGAVFTSCIAQAPGTRYSLPSLLTGRYPSSAIFAMPADLEERLKQLGRKNDKAAKSIEKISRVRIGAGISSVAVLLKERGYETAAFVANPIVNYRIIGLEEQFDWFYKGPYCPSGDCAAQLNAVALDWVATRERHSDTHQKPWFHYIHYMDVHFPYDPPSEYAKRFHDRYEQLPKVTAEWLNAVKKEGPTKHELHHATSMYVASLAYLDSELCTFVRSLREEIPEDELLIVIASDHGDEFYEHGNFLHGQSLYQELTRCPLIMVWPGHIPTGSRSDATVQNVDIVPTILELIGVDIPERIEGSPLTDLFEGSTVNRLAFSENQGVAIWNRNWKLWKDRSGRLLLFDLDSDPQERQNLASAYPDTLAILASQLDQWKASLSPPGFSERPLESLPLDSSLVEMMRELGYVE
jgi:arylsulfatase A-like enzyme